MWLSPCGSGLPVDVSGHALAADKMIVADASAIIQACLSEIDLETLALHEMIAPPLLWSEATSGPTIKVPAAHDRCQAGYDRESGRGRCRPG